MTAGVATPTQLDRPSWPGDPGEPARRPAPRTAKQILGWIAEHTLLVFLAVIFLYPIFTIVVTSFMGSSQTMTGALWPSPWVPENYANAVTTAPLLRWFGNSILYAGLSTLFMLVSSIPMAYVLAKVRIRGSRIIFFLIIVAMLLPPQVTQVPVYTMWAHLHLTGSLWPLILANLFGDAYSIFLMRQFFLTIPSDYIDAARVDGNGEWGTLIRVMIPMAKPGIASAAIFSFFGCWNDFYGPLLYASENENAWPVAFGLASFHSTHSTDWGITMAVTLLAAIPVAVVFFFAQKVFVEGITITGIK